MSFFDKLVEDVAADFMSAVSDRLSTTSATHAVEMCCRELRWPFDNRMGPGKILRLQPPSRASAECAYYP